MSKRTSFEDYRDSYENFELEMHDDGILLVRQHTDGGSLVWNAQSHDRMADVFGDISGDYDVRCVILTGAGDNFNADWGFLAVGAKGAEDGPKKGFVPPIEFYDSLAWFGRRLIMNLLEIDAPMIAAVNGPCNMHSEVPLMCDIVLASEDAYFDDGPHFPRGIVPGDGQHIIWKHVIGPTRAKYFLLTDQRLSAQQAMEWGAVNEVLPKDGVVDRAFELAREIVKRPPMASRYTRRLLTRDLKRAVLDDLDVGIWKELYAQRQFYPVGGGMGPLRQAWNSEDPFAE